jgi:hypothetical protein
MRIVLALLLVAHGIAHLPGFLVDWQLRSFPELPFRTTIFGGVVDVGTTGIKVVGLSWLMVALTFVAAAVGVVMRAPWWQPVVYPTLAASVIMTLAGWPDARFGLLANAVIVILIAIGRRLGAL